MKRLALALAAAMVATATAPRAAAFCGFYVSGSGQKLANDATQVVMMRRARGRRSRCRTTTADRPRSSR